MLQRRYTTITLVMVDIQAKWDSPSRAPYDDPPQVFEDVSVGEIHPSQFLIPHFRLSKKLLCDVWHIR